MAKKVDLTQQEMVAVLLTIYQELKIVFRHMEPFGVSGEDDRKKAILKDIRYLLQKGAKIGLRNKHLYSLFEGVAAKPAIDD